MIDFVTCAWHQIFLVDILSLCYSPPGQFSVRINFHAWMALICGHTVLFLTMASFWQSRTQHWKIELQWLPLIFTDLLSSKQDFPQVAIFALPPHCRAPGKDFPILVPTQGTFQTHWEVEDAYICWIKFVGRHHLCLIELSSPLIQAWFPPSPWHLTLMTVISHSKWVLEILKNPTSFTGLVPLAASRQLSSLIILREKIWCAII